VMPIQWKLEFKVDIDHFNMKFHQRIYDHSQLISSPIPFNIKRK
jgi:hypothetical protein